MIRVLTVDDTNRPAEFALSKWIKKGEWYNVTHIYYHHFQKRMGFVLAERDLSGCEPYVSFDSKRFALHGDDFDAFLELLEKCSKLSKKELKVVADELEKV